METQETWRTVQTLEFTTIAPVIKELSKPGAVYVDSFCEMWIQAVKSDLFRQLGEAFSDYDGGDHNEYGYSGILFSIIVDSPTERRLYITGY